MFHGTGSAKPRGSILPRLPASSWKTWRIDCAPRRSGPVGGMLESVDTIGRVSPRQPVEYFDGVRDELLLAPLRTGQIVEVKFNRGGSSISLRIDFDNGGRLIPLFPTPDPQTLAKIIESFVADA